MMMMDDDDEDAAVAAVAAAAADDARGGGGAKNQAAAKNSEYSNITIKFSTAHATHLFRVEHQVTLFALVSRNVCEYFRALKTLFFMSLSTYRAQTTLFYASIDLSHSPTLFYASIIWSENLPASASARH